MASRMILRPSRRCSTHDARWFTCQPHPSTISSAKPLRIHSNQTLQLDRFTVIRLKDGSDCLMITNDDHERGNENIALVGGVWDMHNEGQSLAEYQKTRNWKGAYEPARYLGVLMRFNRVKRLTLRGLTLKDPVTFSTQLGNLEEFTIEDIAFDHNLKRTNMDGIHVHGNSRHGRITNLKGATNDDLVALNADDGGIFEMSRGAIEDVVVDGLWAKDGYTAVRLLSAGSPTSTHPAGEHLRHVPLQCRFLHQPQSPSRHGEHLRGHFHPRALLWKERDGHEA